MLEANFVDELFGLLTFSGNTEMEHWAKMG